MAYINGLKTFFGGIPRTGGAKWAGLYTASMLYSKGSIVAYQGSVYLKISTAAAGTFPTDTSAWKFLGKAVSGSETVRVNGKHNIAGAEYVDVQTATENSWEGDYEPGKNYTEGQIVVHQGIVYIVIKDTNSDPTDDTAFAPVTELTINSPLPIEVSTEAEMTALLESGEVGGVYKYTGTTGTYKNGTLYILTVPCITAETSDGYYITDAKGSVLKLVKEKEVELSELAVGGDFNKYFESRCEIVKLPYVTRVKPYAFYNDDILRNIDMPSVTSIGDYAFYKCTNLALTELPNGLTSIGHATFSNCPNLALTSLPSGLTSIRQSAFENCSNLALTDLPSGLISIGSSAFSYCKSLALTELPGGLTSIGSHAFYKCTNLPLTSLPSGVIRIGNSTFYDCNNLALTSLPSGLTSIGDYAFYDCTNLALTSLPSGLTSIGDDAFYYCTNLALTELPNGLTSIGDFTFSCCYNLALTSLPSGLTSIGSHAFYDCTNLALTSLPSGLTSIGDDAFFSCDGLTVLTFKGTPTAIASSAFSRCTNLTTINVPWAEGAVANAPWGAGNATINYNYTEE